MAVHHDMAAVEALQGGYVVRCSCGWRSATLTRTEIAEVWDRHRLVDSVLPRAAPPLAHSR